MEINEIIPSGIADRRKNILKGFVNIDSGDIEKARHGTYGDNAQNRKLNRVGQEYGHAGKKYEPKGAGGSSDEVDGKSIEEHASNTDSETLKKVVASKTADEALIAAAKRELTSRGEKHVHNEPEKEDDKSKMEKNKEKFNKLSDEQLLNVYKVNKGDSTDDWMSKLAASILKERGVSLSEKPKADEKPKMNTEKR